MLGRSCLFVVVLLSALAHVDGTSLLVKRNVNTYGSSYYHEDQRLAWRRQQVRNKLQHIISEGLENLQIIADFDRTLTKSSSKGTHVVLFAYKQLYKGQSPALSESFKELCDTNYDFYGEIEKDPSIPMQDKIPQMRKWYYSETEALTKENLYEHHVQQAVHHYLSQDDNKFRQGFPELLTYVIRKQIPFAIMSAGLGNVIDEVMRQLLPDWDSVFSSKIPIVGNFLEFDGPGGKCSGVATEEIVHMFNKNEKLLPESYPKKRNVIILGDTDGDATMASEENHVQVLRIGFPRRSDQQTVDHLKRAGFDLTIPPASSHEASMEVVMQILVAAQTQHISKEAMSLILRYV